MASVSTYNLILFHAPKHGDVSDLMTVRNMMVGRAPDIQVHILSTAHAVPPDFWRLAAGRPSLIFSASALRLNAPVRGTRLISHNLSKLEEMELMTAAGFAVPEARVITPEMRLDEAEWGPFTVVKPNGGIRGRGIRLVRTRDVRWIDTAKLPKDDPRHNQQLLAQRFVDTGPFITCYRVMTLLGRPVYCAASTAVERRPELDTGGTDTLDVPVAVNGMARKIALSNESEIIEVAASLHDALPHLPVMGVDVIREHGTGRLFVLEFNSHGHIWHLSTKLGYSMQHDNGIDFYGQFNALSTIADALIEATRERAT